jgi:hypothetical protein
MIKFNQAAPVAIARPKRHGPCESVERVDSALALTRPAGRVMADATRLTHCTSRNHWAGGDAGDAAVPVRRACLATCAV